MAVKGLVPSLRLQQSPSVSLGAICFSFNGAEVGPDKLGLLSLQALAHPCTRLLLHQLGIRLLGDSQSLELNFDVLGGAAPFQSWLVLLIFIAQDITLFDETVRKLRQASVGVTPWSHTPAVLPALSRRAAAALGATAQAALI